MPHGSFVMSYIEHELTTSYDWHSDGDSYTLGIPKQGEPTIRACLVAHVDTVCKTSVEVVKSGPILFNSHGILGADDRAGCYIALEIGRRMQKKPAILLTNYEEQGGIGVKTFINSLDYWLLDEFDVNIFVEYDRHGTSEVVFYSPPEQKVVDIAALFGYDEYWGVYSDVADLSDATGTAHCNFSAGYIGEHTTTETLNIHGVRLAIETGMYLVPQLAEEKRLLEPKAYRRYGNYDSHFYGGTAQSDEDYLADYRQQCSYCGCFKLHTTVIDKGLVVCEDCDVDINLQCDACLDLFPYSDVVNHSGMNLCPTCRKNFIYD